MVPTRFSVGPIKDVHGQGRPRNSGSDNENETRKKTYSGPVDLKSVT